MATPLLLKFREKTGAFSAERKTLKACADKLGISETTAAHLAINRLYVALHGGLDGFDLPKDAPDDKPGEGAAFVGLESLLGGLELKGNRLG